MAAIQREIIFRADDSQFSSIVDRIGKNISNAFGQANNTISQTNRSLSDFSDSVARELDAIQKSGRDAFESLLQSSEKYGKSNKDRLNFLQREISLQERLVSQEREREKMAAKMAYEAKRRNLADVGAGTAQFQAAKDEYDEQLTQIEADEKVRKAKQQAMRNAYEQYRNDTLNEEGENKGRGGGSRGGVLSNAANTGRGVVNSALGAAGFGAVLTIAGFVGKAISEGEELARARGSFSGLSRSGSSMGVGPMYEMKTADSLKYAEQLAQSSGSIRNIGSRARDQYSFEKAFSLEAGEMNSMSGALRMSGGRSATSVGLEMLNFFKQSKVFGVDKGDFTRVSELLNVNNELNSQQVEQMERIDPSKSSNLMRMFGKMGIDSSRISSYASSINQGITNPKDEFSQAIIYRALKQQNPNMSLFELQERQEQGIYGKGNLSAVMRQFSGSSSGQMLMKNISTAFGIKGFQARQLVEAYEKDNNIFDTDKGISKARQITEADVAGRAANATTTLQTLLRDFNEKFASWGEKMLSKLGEYVDAYQSGGWKGLMKEIGKDLKEAIVDGFNDVYDYVTGKDKAKDEYGQYFKDKGMSTVDRFFRETALYDDTPGRRNDFNAKKKAFLNNKNGRYKSGNMFNTGSVLPNLMVRGHQSDDFLGEDGVIPVDYIDEIKNQVKTKNSYKIRTKNENLFEDNDMTKGEVHQVLTKIAANIGRYDSADGKSDYEVQEKVLVQILNEIRKGNQSRNNTNNTIKKR